MVRVRGRDGCKSGLPLRQCPLPCTCETLCAGHISFCTCEMSSVVSFICMVEGLGCVVRLLPRDVPPLYCDEP